MVTKNFFYRLLETTGYLHGQEHRRDIVPFFKSDDRLARHTDGRSQLLLRQSGSLADFEDAISDIFSHTLCKVNYT